MTRVGQGPGLGSSERGPLGSWGHDPRAGRAPTGHSLGKEGDCPHSHDQARLGYLVVGYLEAVQLGDVFFEVRGVT